MRQWMVLYRKENLEMWRNFKWIWVPFVFLLLGIMQPTTTYYLPQIIDTMGGLPEGTVIVIPSPSGAEVIVETYSQFSFIGVLILILASMSIVSGERQSGVAGLILVKPVSFISYITAKWAGISTLTLVSFWLGMIGAWYYTEILFDHVDWIRLVLSSLIYSMWLIFVVTVTVFFSTIIRGAGGGASLTLAVVFILSIVTPLFQWIMGWSPAMLTSNASSVLITGTTLSYFWVSLAVSVAAIAALIIAAATLFKHKELVV